jgi:hypothetical protein
MKTFAQFDRWRDLKGDALAWALFEYLSDTRTGLFALGQGAREGRDAMYEYELVRDPVKLINVYGYAYCDVLGPVMEGIWEDAGFGPARTLDLTDWHHVVSEASYSGAWHYLDLDVRAAFRRPDGTLASMDEAKRDDSLWKGPRGPRFFPMDDLAHVRSVYAKEPVLHRYGVHQSGHTMDFVLRQGETFTRWWQPQGGRWNHSTAYADSILKIIARLPVGPKCKHDGFSIYTHGNGRFVYEPNLTDRSSDFDDGVYDAKNVRPGAAGLTLAGPGDGYAVFEIHTPYIIVPLVGDMAKTDDDRDASVVQIDADGAALSISLDNGKTWQSIESQNRPATIDLTRHVTGTYGYLLKIALSDRGNPTAGPVVRSLAITTWVQVAPASLPALRRGANRMDLRAGDHYGLPSRVLAVTPNGGDRADLLKHLVEPPRDYDPARKTSRIHGPLTVRVDAPPDSRIAWLSAGASFQTYTRDSAARTRNTIAYAVDQPSDFKEIYRAEIPADQEHWHYNAAREIKLDAPTRTAFVRYAGDPAVNTIRIFAHCIDDRAPRPSPVAIKHVWKEDGVEKARTVTLDAPGPYEIDCAAEPENVSIELTVPSRPAF